VTQGGASSSIFRCQSCRGSQLASLDRSENELSFRYRHWNSLIFEKTLEEWVRCMGISYPYVVPSSRLLKGSVVPRSVGHAE
jgi:hypothetical protein